MTTAFGMQTFALAVVAIGLLPLTVGAQVADRFERRNVPVIAPANSFLDETSGKGYAHGASVVLSRKSSPKAVDLQRKGLQARMFRLDSGAARPRPWHTIGNCEVYQTSVLPLIRQVKEGDSSFVLNSFTDDGWLSPNTSRGVMERGRYLMVFEQSEDVSRVFRLDKDEKDKYFNAGFEFVLEPRPDRKYTAADVKAVNDALESRRGNLDAESRIHDSSRVCYRMLPLRLAQDAEGQTFAILVPCELSDEMSAAIH